ncbi:CPBP family intramembrane metalloprotease [Clostridium sartagoforme]|uniref:CPBP family intramembrane metalloprotease n=1 Tax=Clostridium sartagoforme TaxID=84031 RepID=A0A4V3RKR9_9CLOT|nr:type II CAAX endopeptidase family protein [Clostridium sartagoforme]TGY40960.1 CPBP family intramembrane metalloprotease [Clostridium sartagoforme]
MKEIKIWKVLLVWFFMPIVVAIIMEMLNISTNKTSEYSDVTFGFLMFLGILLVFIKIGKVNINLVKERYNDFEGKFNGREMIEVVITQILLSMGLSYLSTGFTAIFNVNKALAIVNDTSGNPSTLIQLILYIILIVVLAPVLEEIVFRRILFNRMSKRLSFFMAAIVSSIIFAIGHDIFGIAGAAAFGIACCLLYRKYENILASMTLHFINNLIAGIMLSYSYFMGTLHEQTETITSADIKYYFIAGGIVTAISLILFIRFVVRNINYIKSNNGYINSNIN